MLQTSSLGHKATDCNMKMNNHNDWHQVRILATQANIVSETLNQQRCLHRGSVRCLRKFQGVLRLCDSCCNDKEW